MIRENTNNMILDTLFRIFNIKNKPDKHIEDVKANLLMLIIYILSLLGVPVILGAMIMAIKVNQFFSPFIYLLLYLPIFIAFILRKKAKQNILAFLILITGYMLGFSDLYIYGISGLAIPIFLALYVLTSIFLNLKSALISILLSAGIMLIFGYLFVNNILSVDITLYDLSVQGVAWISVSLVLIFLGSIIVLSFGFIQQKMLEKTIISQQQALNLEQDILERKKTEICLKKSEERLSLALDGSASGIWDWNLKTSDVFFDAKYFTISGYQPNEFPHDYEEWKKRVHPDDLERVEKIIAEYIGGKKVEYKAEYRFKKKDGTWMWILARGKIFEHDDEAKPIRFTGTHSDITSNKLTEKALVDSKKKLQETIAVKDKFFSIISHDLKNPLGSIFSFTDLLFNNYDQFDKVEKKKAIETIKNTSKKAFNLLENLLEWSRIQMGNIEFNPEKLNITKLVNEEFELIKLPIAQKEIQLSVNSNQDNEVFADKNMVSTIIRNLLSNALKYTTKGGSINISFKEASNSNNKKLLETMVADSGVGMTSKQVEKLFKIGEGYSTKGVDGEKGTGLGLILCKEFVEKNGGKIWVESEVAKGSRFSFLLPQI